MMGVHLLDLGDLLLAIVLFSSAMVVLAGCAERRRAHQRQQQILDMIEREYEAYFRT